VKKKIIMKKNFKKIRIYKIKIVKMSNQIKLERGTYRTKSERIRAQKIINEMIKQFKFDEKSFIQKYGKFTRPGKNQRILKIFYIPTYMLV